MWHPCTGERATGELCLECEIGHELRGLVSCSGAKGIKSFANRQPTSRRFLPLHTYELHRYMCAIQHTNVICMRLLENEQVTFFPEVIEIDE